MLLTIVFAVVMVIAIVIATLADIARKKDKEDYEEDLAAHNGEVFEENEQQHHRRQKAMMVAIIIAVIIAIIGGGVAIASAATSFALPEPAAEETEENDPTPEEKEARLKAEDIEQGKIDFTVDLEALTRKKYDSVSYVLLESSLSPKDAERVARSGFSDALTMPFTAGNDTGKVAELQEEILRNPVYGVGFANFLKDKKIADTNLGELNPWMNEMIARNEVEGVTNWLTYYNGDKSVIYVTDEYRTYAAALCTLLEQLINEGVQTRHTSENWCLNAALMNNDRKATPASYQYTKEALVLTYVGKNGTELLTIGFNIHDKRFELFGEEPTPEPVVPETPAEPNAPGTGGGNPPSPGPSPGPNPPDNPIKDPTKDPAVQGNAPVGGGHNQTEDGPGTFEPEDHPAQSAGADPSAGNDDGSSKPSNQVQDPSATQDNSTPPAVEEIPVTKNTTVTDDRTGKTTNTSEEKSNDGVVELDD